MGKVFTHFKKKVAQVTIVCMMFTLVPSTVVAATASDLPGHWAQATIQNWVDQGIIKGYEDGTFRPENNISRAEFMTLVNGIFGYTEMKVATYRDVKADDWYADAVIKAAAAGYINGYPDGTMRPDNPISREEAATIIMKITKLMENEDVSRNFTDANTLVWSKGAVGSVNFSKIMNGYPDGSFQPQNYIKRGEAVFALDQSVIFCKSNVIYDKAGTYGTATGDLQVSGNVIVQVKGTVLQNMVIAGDLIIDKNVGDGNVTLKNVTVKGETKIYGGGLNSIIVIDSTLGNVTIAKVDGKIRIVISGNTTVGSLTANSGATIEEGNLTRGSEGFQEIIIDAKEGDIIIFIGFFTDININAPGISIDLAKGTNVEHLTVNEETEVGGEGTVKNAIINASGTTFEKAPANMVVAPGITAPIIENPTTRSSHHGGEVEATLVQAYTDAADAAAFVTLLNANALTLTLTDYADLDDIGKTAVGSAMLGVNTFVDKAAVQSAVTTAIANAKVDSDARAAEAVLVAEYTNAIDAAAVTALLATSPNALGLTLTNYAGLDATGKTAVAADLFAAKAGLTTKELIQTALTTAIANTKFTYTTSAGAVTITGYTGTDTVITIPTTLGGIPVKTITNSAFINITTLTSITVQSGVTSIGNYAFNGCSGLTSLIIPEGVTSIGEFAFAGCKKLTSFNIPNTVTNIGTFTFYNCTSLANITIPDSMTFIAGSMFKNCNALTNVSIPSSVTKIWAYAFDGCSKLTTLTIPSSVTSILTNAFLNCTSLTSITIPSSVKVIEESTFKGCISLASASIGNSVTTIGKNAFYGCKALNGITIPNSVTNIGIDAFRGCTRLTSMTIPNSVTSMGNEAFNGCTSLASITIGSGVTNIGDYLFYGCTSLTEVSIPDNVTRIGAFSFYGCTSLTGAAIGSGVTTIDVNAFQGCTALTGVTIGSSVMTIGDFAFQACTSLASINFSQSVTSIGDSAFQGCTALTGITIPEMVTTIGENSFGGCTGLTSVTMQRANTNIGDNLMGNNNFFRDAYTALEGREGTYTGNWYGPWTKESV